MNIEIKKKRVVIEFYQDGKFEWPLVEFIDILNSINHANFYFIPQKIGNYLVGLGVAVESANGYFGGIATKNNEDKTPIDELKSKIYRSVELFNLKK